MSFRWTYSTIEKRYPMQACGPPKKVSILPQTPGIDDTVSGIFSQRSGLVLIRTWNGFEYRYTDLNSRASSPHNALDKFTARIGMTISWPFVILESSLNEFHCFNINVRQSLPNVVALFAVSVIKRYTQGQDVVFHCYPRCRRHRSMETQAFPHYKVQIG